MNRRKQQADIAAENELSGVIGLGPLRIAALNAAGIKTRADLARLNADRLVREFGLQPAYAARALEMVQGAAMPARPATTSAVTGDTKPPARRGRPPKALAVPPAELTAPPRRGRPPRSAAFAEATPTTPARRGRPPKATLPSEPAIAAAKRRGRPPKATLPTEPATVTPTRRGRRPRLPVAPENVPAPPEEISEQMVDVATAAVPEVPEMVEEAATAPETESTALSDLDSAERLLRTAIANATQRYPATERPLLRVAVLLDKLPGCAERIPRRKQRKLANLLEDLAERLERAVGREGDLSPKREERLRDRIRQDRRVLADAIAAAEAPIIS